nr:reverse transcriptase domain-containing protein [Tanacetum cinerariifolium]
IPTTSSSLPQVVERETEVTKDTVPLTNNGSTKDVQPAVVQIETLMLNFEPVVAPVIEPVAAPVSALKPNPKPSIPYPSRLHDQKLLERGTKATKDTVHPTYNGNTKDVQPPVVQTESLILNSEPFVAPIIEPVTAPVSAPQHN